MADKARSTRNEWLTGCALLLVLIVTRSGHFGSSIKLPDASWAIFWLAGALTQRWLWPVILMISAALVDYVVISHGVDSYCFTPAYPFLMLAYLALWITGRWVSSSLQMEVRSLLRIAVSVLSGVTIAFFISNASFYFLSGYFPAMPAWQYTQAVMQYWPIYLWHTAMYAFTGLLIQFIAQPLRDIRVTQH